MLEHKWQVALRGEPQSAPWKSARSEEGKSSMFLLAARWLKEKRQSLSFTGVQLPRRQMAEWEIFFLRARESLKRCPGERDWRLFFRWLSNDWMWLAQIISLITAQQAQIGPRARPSPPPAALHAFNQPCQPESHGAETARFLQSEIPPVTEETDLWSLDYVKMLY